MTDLRGLKSAVLNPSNLDISEAIRHLSRIGVSTRVLADVRSLNEYDFVFVVIGERFDCETFRDFPPTPKTIRVAILDSETPTVLEYLRQLDADAVLVKPFRSAGILACLVQARNLKNKYDSLLKRSSQLERKLAGFRTVEKAKEIVARKKGITADEAFVIIRRHAMDRQSTIEEVAETMVSAERLISFSEARPRRSNRSA